MKHFLMLTAAAMIMGAPLAYAQDDAAAPSAKGEKEHHGMFERSDANGDGVITKEEFLAGAEEHFAKMDANGDGSITQDEMKAMREKMHEKRKEWIEKRKERSKSGAEGEAKPQDAE